MSFKLFDQFYVFKSKGSMRVGIRKYENGEFVTNYHLLGDGCTCPAMQKTRTCKHRKMWEGTFVGDEVPTSAVMPFVDDLMKSLGLPFDKPDPATLPKTMTHMELTLTKSKDYDKAVGLVTIGGKMFVVILKPIKNVK